MGKFKLEHDRPNCIGCAACAAVAPDFWEMNDDGKSDIIDAPVREDAWQEKEIDEKDFQANKEAADACPVNVIHIIEDGKQII